MNSVTCKQTSKPYFIQGQTYKVDTAYDKMVIVVDSKGQFHHLDTQGEFYADHFKGGN